MRLGSWIVMVLVLGACGEGAPPGPRPSIVATPAEEPTTAQSETSQSETSQSVTSESETTATVDSVGQAVPAVPPPLLVAEPGQAYVFVEDSDLYLDSSLELTHVERERTIGPERSLTYPEVTHPDARAGRLVNERLSAFAIAAEGRGESEVGGTSCDVKLATRHLVTMMCIRTETDERGGGIYYPSALHLRIDERGVHAMQIAEAFVPGTDLAAIVRQACRAQEADEIDLRDDPRCAASPSDYTLVLGRDSLEIETTADDELMRYYTVEVDYASLASQLLAAGPFALSLDRRDVETRAIAVSGAAPASAPTATAWAVMPMASLPELAAAWASLPSAQRPSVRRAGSYLVATDEASARAAAATLGTAASSVSAPATGDGLVLVRTTREQRLRAQPDRRAEELGPTLARGTLLVIPQALGGAGFVQAVAHAELSGFIDLRHVEAADPCVPDLAPFLATLPEDARAGARVRTLRSALREGSWGRATYVTQLGDVSHIELRRIEEGCAIERSLARFTRPGALVSLAVSRTARRGGEALIVTVTSEPSVAIHTFGTPEPVWTRALASGDRVETSERDGDAWFPVVITPVSGAPFRLTWGESGPVGAAAP